MTPRLGFLGTGWIGRHRMAAMLATGAVEAAAVADPSPEMLADARALAPDAAVVPDLAAMLALGLDGVVIATPSALHADQSVAALQAGAAVFCQKPLGRTAAEAAAVVDAARAADRLLGVDFSYRHTAGMQAIRALLADGALGRPFAADLVFHNAYGPGKPWFWDRAQSGGGCVIDLGVHLVDLALWALDWPEVAAVESRLFAAGAPLAGDACEDFATATLTLADGGAIRLACSWNLHAGTEAEIAARFWGTAGGAALRNVDGSFYRFAADRFAGTERHPLAPEEEDWGGRAAAAWARALTDGARFDPEADRLVDVARVLDRIYSPGR
jgi:predicted dehydrogenase